MLAAVSPEGRIAPGDLMRSSWEGLAVVVHRSARKCVVTHVQVKFASLSGLIISDIVELDAIPLNGAPRAAG